MTRQDIERFFLALSRRWQGPMDTLLIGGSAAILAGSRRPTLDVDFEARLGAASLPEDSDLIADAVDKAIADSGVQAQFTEDIAAWSEIALPPYRQSARLWKRFGRVTVRLLAPSLFAVSKLRRGLDRDYVDTILVLRNSREPWQRLARACGTAARMSPRSTRLPRFLDRVEYLFHRHGRELWGPRFDPKAAIGLFRRSYRKRSPASTR